MPVWSANASDVRRSARVISNAVEHQTVGSIMYKMGKPHVQHPNSVHPEGKSTSRWTTGWEAKDVGINYEQIDHHICADQGVIYMHWDKGQQNCEIRLNEYRTHNE